VYNTSSGVCFSNKLADMTRKFQAAVCTNAKIFGSFLLRYNNYYYPDGKIDLWQ